MSTADRSGYNLSAYALAILVHIYNSLIIWDAYRSFRIFKICKTIVDVRICNEQLKTCGPFIFDQTVLHLVTIVLQILNMRKDM